LEGALEQFAHDVTGKVVLDAGLSTGGFSDCLLQNGATRIYGVDVGYGQVKFSSNLLWPIAFLLKVSMYCGSSRQ
jgi:predicted rRNA methylase YqxC with S4 and FtsJ domains